MSQPMVKDKKKEPYYKNPFVRKLLVYIISLCIVIGITTFAIKYTYNKLTNPVDANDNNDVVVVIPMGTSVRGIGNILYEEGLIRNKGAFKIFMEFSDSSSDIKAGKYKLKKSMDLTQVIEAITSGEGAIPQIKFTIPEGRTVKQIANALEESGKFDFTEEEFLEEASNIEKYQKRFPDLQGIPEERLDTEKYPHPLEGYLFPETYFVDEGATPEEIINTMVAQFMKVYGPEYRARAEELDLSIDQVVTLASLIQGEARVRDEFPKIAAVLHNRLERQMALGLNAPIYYITGKNSLYLTKEETKVDSPYNTYIHSGLPVGPISCPGELAIKAALYPDEDMMDPEKPYLYFVLMDPKEGRHAFNYDHDAHLKDTEKYKPLWKDATN